MDVHLQKLKRKFDEDGFIVLKNVISELEHEEIKIYLIKFTII